MTDVRHESQHWHARPRPEGDDGGAVVALALAGLAIAVAGMALVLPAVRAGADGPRRAAPVVASTDSEPAVAPETTRDRPAPASTRAPVLTTAGAPPLDAAPPDAAPPDASAPDAAPAPLPLGACLRTGVADVATAQADLDAGCTVELAYGPARWLAAHDHDAGDAWKAMPDGTEFAYAGRTYRVVDRTRAAYVTGPVALDPLVHGDLTLQTCDGADELVFLHAALVA